MKHTLYTYTVSDGIDSMEIEHRTPELAVEEYFDGYDWADGKPMQPYTVEDEEGNIVLSGTWSKS